MDALDHPLSEKTNKVRSILSSPPETAINRNNKFSPGASRRSFESETNDGKIESPQSTSLRPAYKRRTLKSGESASGRVGNYRKSAVERITTTVRPRRQFTPRQTSESPPTVPDTTSTPRAAFKKPTRGTFRPKTAKKTSESDDENYPEHFKSLLKNKEVITDKNVLKKPSKVFGATEKPTKALPKPKVNAALYSRQRFSKSTTEASQLATEPSLTTKRAILRTRPPPRPTERAKISIGSTLQEPPTAKVTPVYATRASVKQPIVEELNTQFIDDTTKQIDPPLNEKYFPRTSAVSVNYFIMIEFFIKFFNY